MSSAAVGKGKFDLLISKSHVLALALGALCAAFGVGLEAADRPVRQAAPVEYVRSCNGQDSAYLYLPGTGLCWRSISFVSGEQRAYHRFDQKVFIQFAGLTAGRAPSAFVLNADAGNCESLRGSNARVALLALTAAFGDGFSAALYCGNQLSPSAAAAGRVVVTAFARDSSSVSAQSRTPETAENDSGGAAHQLRVSRFDGNGLAPISPLPAPASLSPPFVFPALTSGSYGLPGQGDMPLNVDYLSPSDKLWLQATYEKGAAGYNADGNLASAHDSSGQTRILKAGPGSEPDIAVWNPQISSGCVFAGSGKCEQPRGWDIGGACRNYWLPILSPAFFGSYLEGCSLGDAANSPGGAPGGAKLAQTPIEPGLFRSPLRGFDIGAEYMYTHLSQARPNSPAPDPLLATHSLPAFSTNSDISEGRLRVQRAF